MASTDARPVPRKNAAFRHYFAIRKNDGTLITSWTGADSEVSLDGAAFSDCTNEATEIGSSGCGYIDLTSAEMNADAVVLKITVTNASALPLVFVLYPEESGDYRIDASALATAAALATLDGKVDTIDGIVDAILVDTDTTIPGTLATIADYIDTEIAAIKAKTDNLPANPAAVSDIPTANAIADQVWDEAIAGHAGVGSTGAALAAAGSAGDPWSTTLPGAYGAGTAGNIVGNNLNATVSSRLATAGYTAPLDAAGIRAAVGLAAANLDTQLSTIDTVADGIKAKTDSLTFTVAGQVDANIQYVNDVQVTGDGQPGTEWGPA